MSKATTLASKRKQKILIVDDEPANRSLLDDMLNDIVDIDEATNGLEAIARIRENGNRFSLILLDIVMPEMGGLEVLELMNKNGWIDDIPVIMVSTDTKPETINKAFKLGATDFISRPFNMSIVRNRVVNTLSLYANQRALASMVEDEIKEKERSVSMMVSVLSQIVEFRNGESGRHVVNVNAITEMLLQSVIRKTDQYDIDRKDIETIKLASSLHDIGKITIPEEILNKPGKLTDDEFDRMKEHSAAGADMLKDLPMFDTDPLLKASHDICRWHHERYDGRGYPDGLKGDEIPISAQVVAIADVYDALTSKRVYKDAFSHEKAMGMILAGECGTFNPLLLECLEDIADDLKEAMERDDFPASAYRLADSIAVNVKTTAPLRRAADDAASSRTISLLDYERIKYEFYAKMSGEIQFEYSCNPSMVIFHDYGDVPLNVDEIVYEPMNDAKMIKTFGKRTLSKVKKMVSGTTFENPIIQTDILGIVDDMPRWFHMDARSLWEEDENGLYISGVVGKLVDIQESKAHLSDLEKKATTDDLTELTNHAYAKNIITTRMKENPDDIFCLMVLDMDKFKDANDEHGHLFGDDVLKYFAKKLKRCVRGNDIVARVGGDEFLICIQPGDNSQLVIDRIFDQLKGEEYEGFPISVSMGVEIAKGSDMPYTEFFSHADGALYTMKRNGRGGYRIYQEGDSSDEHAGSVISKIESDEE